MLDELDPTVAKAFEAAVALLRQQGARIAEIDVPLANDLSRIQSNGGLSAAESWAWHRQLLAERGDRYDPRVALRIRRGETMSAADYIEMLRARTDWIARMEAALCHFDAVLSPTVPIVAPSTASIASDDAEFFRINALLLRNTSVVNMLDGCALSLPCHSPDQLQVGLMVWSTSMQDDMVLDISLAIEAALSRRER
jgi:Asp-tRNA(Asn)/Glu-tRNA(Gln) amidotransferase A subunit family amidase